MKKLLTIYALITAGVFANQLNAQGKPKLIEINYLVLGQSVSQTSNGDVTVELKFDKAMNQSVDPNVKFGIDGAFGLTVPEGQGWISGTLWQGFFTVSNNNPETGDGLYHFKIYGAKDIGGAEMDTTFTNQASLNKGLHICRSGELDLSTANLNFGAIAVGSSKTLQVTISNESCAELHISNVTLPAPFSLVNSSSEFTIPGGGVRILSVLFRPTSRANFNGAMTVFSDDRFQASHTISLSGSARGPHVVLSPDGSLNFGKIEVGLSSTKTVKVSNRAAAVSALSDTLHITSITTNNEVFSVIPTSITIAPGDTKSVEVTFAPTQNAVYNGYTLTFNHDDLLRNESRIILNGDASDESPPASVTNLRATWSGYGGFTNASSLAICWDNPDDPSGIAEIWWKFTRTPNAPESPADTTAAGGRIVLASGATCASLRLFGRLTTGFWYCYIWLVDGNGNSGYANAVRTSFIYDINPPGIPRILGRSIPSWRWFGFNSSFRLSLNMPVDPGRGVRDAREVRWKYKTKPNSADDYSGNFEFDGANETVDVTIPFGSPSLCGDDSLFVWLVDSTGNSSSDSVAVVPYKFDICAPEIKRTLTDDQNVAELAVSFKDTVEITDVSGVDTAWVHYRFGGAESEEPPRKLTRIAGTDSFIVDIPQAGVTRRGFEYRIVARDSLENEATGPVSSYCENVDDDDDEIGNWFPMRTRILNDFRIDTDGRPVPLISGEDESNYQLFSIPYDLDTSAVINVLQDDLGAYDNTLWRLFDYKTDSPEASRFFEGANARPFTPGRSYFIISRKENIVIDSGPGVSRRTVCNDTIRVYPGWNLIATPFNFPVARESLSLINAESIITLRSYERGWNISEIMEPWKGYALFVTKPSDQSSETPIYLVVKPKAAAGRLEKSISDFPALENGDWAVQISATAGGLSDLENWAGICNRAETGFDHLELAEPPVIGNFLKVAFLHPEWNLEAREFSTDFRPVDEDEQVWEFEVNTNLPGATVNLSFDFLGDFPNHYEVHLIDEALRSAQNLNSSSSYSFKTGKNGAHKKLKILVGSYDFVSAKAGELGLVPAEFELLQNFPNPFNPETSIRYNLPEATEVKLEIFDLLGRRVATLINARQNAGYYTANWNGRDASGRLVASGVYMYRVSTNFQSIVRKMILLK